MFCDFGLAGTLVEDITELLEIQLPTSMDKLLAEWQGPYTVRKRVCESV